MNQFTYELKESLYLNITNRCNNACTFCIKYRNRDFEGQYKLWLDREPAAQDVIKEIADPSKYKQVVFCGYGESLIRLETVIEISRCLKDKGSYVRINTDGQANLYYGRNIIPSLAGLIDELDISLNAQDETTYNKLCGSIFGKKSFAAVLDFTSSAKELIPKVVLTIVDLPAVDKDACAKIASDLGVDLKVRSYYRTNYTE